MKKTAIICAAIAAAYTAASAFEWPQEQQIQSDSFYSYFGQLRGDTISNSLIFSDPSEIKAADNGCLTVIIKEYNDDTDFFPSTLGNAVIIAHSDNLMTVYGNIDAESLPENLSETKEIATGTPLGISGNSAWQQGHSSLEFQVIDTKNNTAINPRILMPRIGKELPLYPSGIVLQNRNGRTFKIAEQNVIPAGFYRVYQKRQAVAVPYKTHISVNGTIVDGTSYDLLRQDGSSICVSGKRNYPKTVLYPTPDLMLLGEVNFTQGKNAVQFTLSDILGKETSATYYLTNY
ncbi:MULTISPECIES: M23 family metallopeptidase [Treponema]|uniref:M23 family metallopeptidase n=1 Tax=Treponema TaxID=157 RepID=UPI002356E4DB|nr:MULTISPECIES: M23 family metallopeptidase [Treponema]MCI6322759.1 M23 family metallopeptidase [Treponema porcinum]